MTGRCHFVFALLGYWRSEIAKGFADLLTFGLRFARIREELKLIYSVFSYSGNGLPSF